MVTWGEEQHCEEGYPLSWSLYVLATEPLCSKAPKFSDISLSFVVFQKSDRIKVGLIPNNDSPNLQRAIICLIHHLHLIVFGFRVVGINQHVERDFLMNEKLRWEKHLWDLQLFIMGLHFKQCREIIQIKAWILFQWLDDFLIPSLD